MIFYALILSAFSRQKVLGKYIADFYSAEARLVIELDGSQHFEDRNIEKDAARTSFLEGYGLTVIRIPNNEVDRNFREVCEYIDAIVKQSLSQLRWQLPLHKGAFPNSIHSAKNPTDDHYHRSDSLFQEVFFLYWLRR